MTTMRRSSRIQEGLQHSRPLVHLFPTSRKMPRTPTSVMDSNSRLQEGVRHDRARGPLDSSVRARSTSWICQAAATALFSAIWESEDGQDQQVFQHRAWNEARRSAELNALQLALGTHIPQSKADMGRKRLWTPDRPKRAALSPICGSRMMCSSSVNPRSTSPPCSQIL